MRLGAPHATPERFGRAQESRTSSVYRLPRPPGALQAGEAVGIFGQLGLVHLLAFEAAPPDGLLLATVKLEQVGEQLADAAALRVRRVVGGAGEDLLGERLAPLAGTRRLRLGGRLLGLLAAALSVWLIGCGSGGPAPGRAALTVRWPERTRLIPFAADSIRVTLTQGTRQLGTALLVRPSGGGNATAANRIVNAIPAVCAAAPGVVTALDLPPVTGAAQSGRRSGRARTRRNAIRAGDPTP